MFKGIGASAGIGIGSAVLVREPDLDYSHVVFAGEAAEKARLAAAAARFTEKTRAMARKMEEQVGRSQAEILLGQVMMLEDPLLLGQMEEHIARGRCAEGAADAVCRMYAEMFDAMEDELMRQRAADVRDMAARLLGELLERENPDLSALPPDTVLVAHDLTPSMTAGLCRGSVAGILTEAGGTTSHSAILARAMELPAVLSARGVMERVGNGDTLVVDGTEGIALLNPDQGTLARYQSRQRAVWEERAALQRYAGGPTRTADGKAVTLYGNIGTPQEAEQVMAAVGEGIGLFRTEFLFMNRNRLPTEEEQFHAYCRVLDTMAGREVIIRTLDAGGDKVIPCLGSEKADNPALGFRGVRCWLEREDLFRPQLRALLRASAHGELKIMLPLVTRVEEVRRAKALLAQIKAELDEEGTPYNRQLKVGVMMETPAAALLADLLAREADFFSIGTNDLTQYIMAADRGSGRVAELGTPFQPAVLRAMERIIGEAHRAGIPVAVCGEAAADPRMIPLLLAWGVDTLSVSPSAILPTRGHIARWTEEEARTAHDRAMACSTLEEVLSRLPQ